MRVIRHERGAIMVVGLFMAIFLAGLLSYVVGLGETIWQRERMQDAADAAAFSAAVLHARGMNVIALINMTMAALLAVVIALKLLEVVAVIAAGIGLAMCLGLNPVGCGMATFSAQIGREVATLRSSVEPQVKTALRALHLAGRGVRVAMPWVAQARVVVLVNDHYAPPATIGVSIPTRLTLPTQDGTYADVCNKSGEYLGDLVGLPFGLFSDYVGGAIGGLVAEGSSWFCGPADEAKRPSTTVTDTVVYPMLPSAIACRDYSASAGASANTDEHEDLCEEAQRDIERSAPDRATGACVDDCARGGLYEQAAERARIDCAPRGRDDHFEGFRFQRRTYQRTYVYGRGAWQVSSTPDQEEATARYELISNDSRLCGEGSTVSVSPDWNTVFRETDAGPIEPLCTSHAPLPGWPSQGETRSIEHVDVLHVFGCREVTRKRYTIDEPAGGLEPSSDAEGRAMSPQVLEEGAALGGEAFQLRSLVIGELPQTAPERILRLFKRANEARPGIWQRARNLGRVSLAQAEMYYAVEGQAPYDAHEFLWNMRWQARLRRVRFGAAEPAEHAPASERADDAAADAQRLNVGAVATSFEAACRAAFTPTPDSDREESPCELLDLSFQDALVH